MILRGFSVREGSNGRIQVTLSPMVIIEKNSLPQSLIAYNTFDMMMLEFLEILSYTISSV